MPGARAARSLARPVVAATTARARIAAPRRASPRSSTASARPSSELDIHKKGNVDRDDGHRHRRTPRARRRCPASRSSCGSTITRLPVPSTSLECDIGWDTKPSPPSCSFRPASKRPTVWSRPFMPSGQSVRFRNYGYFAKDAGPRLAASSPAKGEREKHTEQLTQLR